MSTSEDLLSAYSFLAALTENENDLFNHVFVPICKRSLSIYSARGKTNGSANDIKQIILDNYGIDIPILLVKKLLKSIQSKMSKNQRVNSKFELMSDGEAFTIGKFAFLDIESKYKKGERQAHAIQKAFAAFVSTEEIQTDETIPSFTDFLNKNKRRLAGFFKGDGHLNGEPLENTYYYHVKFLEFISTSQQELYEIAESLYLGSIVAGFLEAGIDLEPKFSSDEVYYLDTPIVLRALGLQKEEEEKPIQELISLIKASGGTVKVLSITIEEIEGIIAKAIDIYNPGSPTTTINEACLRQSRNKTWLIKLNASLETRILQDLSISVETVPNAFREKVAGSPDIKALKDQRFRKGTAVHDVIAYLYVRFKRGAQVFSYQKAKVWFLTSNKGLLRFNIDKSPLKNCISEIVLPDALTSLLWLKNPTKFLSKVKSIGLTELMAHTLSEEIPSKELIAEFESNIREIKKVSEEEYHILLTSVAHQSAKRIESFNEKVSSDRSSLGFEAQRIVEKERSRRLKEQEKFKEIFKNENNTRQINQQLNDKLEEITKELEKASGERGMNKTLLEELYRSVEEREVARSKFRMRVGLYFLITIVLVIAFFILPKIDVLEKLTSIVKVVIGLSGLWSFVSMMINVVKFFKDVKLLK